jgi:hypothetical protein
MFPGSDDDPTSGSQPRVGIGIAPSVGEDLLSPEAPIRLWPGPVIWATMPEAPVNENCDLGAPKDDIGSAR